MSNGGPSKQSVDNANLLKDLYESINDITADIQRSLEQTKKDQVDIINASTKAVDLAKQQRQLEKDQSKILDKIKAAQKAGNKEEEKLLTLKAEQLKNAKDNIKEAQALQKQVRKAQLQFSGINDQAQKLTESINGFVKSLPGGDQLSRMFGLDVMGDQFEDLLNQTGEKFISVYNNAKAAGMSTADAVAKANEAAMKVFGTGLKGLLNPTTLLVAAIAGLVLLFNNIAKEAKEISKETGLTFGQAANLADEARNASAQFGTILSTTEDILAVQKETIGEFGLANQLTAEQAATVSEIGKSFGFGAQQAAKVNNAFLRMGVSAADAANAQRDLAAESLKAGVSVGTVVADIADNAKDVTKFFGGNIKALQKAAIQAAKLGMSIKEMAKVSDSLLSFEESISAQFELQALTGRQVNFDLARQKALQGDIAGATKEVLNQVGGIAEFNEMDVIQREALAKATGLSVDELQKSLTIQEKLKDAGPEQIAAATKLGLSASELANMSAEDLQNKIAQQQANEKISQSFDSMKATLVNALMPAAEAIMDIFQALSPVLKIIGVIFQGIGAAIKGFIAPIVFVFDIITYIKEGVMSLINSFSFLQPIVSALGMAFDFIKESLTYTGMILGTIFLPNIIAAAAGAISTAVGFLSTAVGAIFSAFGMIPFGIGIPLAGVAVAGLFALFNKAKSAGDLGIDPGGGPIVMSPQVGGVFQGDRRDGISMGPGMGTNPDIGGGGGGGSVAIDYQRMAQAIVTAMAGLKLQPAPIQIGSQVINAISDEMEVIKSYK